MKFTVPLLCVNVPPVWDQLPDTLNVAEGAVKVPEDNVTAVVVTSPLDPVNVPPDTVNPPLKVCRAVEAWYVPPLIVVNPVTVLVKPLALNVPLLLVNAPPRVKLLLVNCTLPLAVWVRL